MAEPYRVRLTRLAEKDIARLRRFRDKALRALLRLLAEDGALAERVRTLTG